MLTLDAMPDVLWTGTLAELKKQDRRAWVERFRARTAYAHCSDVSAAFALAIRHLAGDPRLTNKYLFVFSDLIHEPPTSSLRTCRRPSRPFRDEDRFPWAQLADVSVTALWVPPEETFAWRREIAAHRLEASFVVESDPIDLAAPPRPTERISDAERAARRDRDHDLVIAKLGGAARLAGWLLGLAVTGLFALGLTAFVVRRRRRSARTADPVVPRGNATPGAVRAIHPLRAVSSTAPRTR